MKRFFIIIAIMAAVGIIYWNPVSLYGQTDEPEFADFSGYVQSEYFQQTGKRCLVKKRPVNHRKVNVPRAQASDCSLSKTVIKSEYQPTMTYIIPVVFHIIRKTDGTGNISDQRIYDQVDVLNEDFGAAAGSLGAQGYNTKIQFQLEKITRTANDQWFADKNEFQFKQTLGWDQERYLNVYTNLASGYLGYSYMPQGDAGDVYDGVVMNYEAVGGRGDGSAPYNQGRTLVHEIGHYMGLHHTFEGYGCYYGYQAGDLIADTDSENDEHYGCSQTNTCGTPDPIHNYMNYTDDICMYEFTSEQANRMICCIINYRPLLYQTSSQPSIKVTSPNGGESWAPGSKHSITWTTTGTVEKVKIQYSTDNGGNWTTITSSTANDGSYSWTLPNVLSNRCLVRIREASDGSPSDTSDAVFSITSSTSPAISLNRTRLNFGAAGASVTGSQEIWIDNSGGGTLNWSASVDKSWLSCSPTSGTNGGIVSVSVNPAGLAAGTYSGQVAISSTNSSVSGQKATVYLIVKNAAQDQPPFGDFATPTHGSTVRSSVPVTGWVLDDVEVKSVKIYNGNAYIGDAVFVDGARPDVEQTYPAYPNNCQAGWGYMMLTYFLPNNGNGVYTLYAKAVDSAGKLVTLGSKTITIDNDSAVKPFGAIDTPTQGGTASGKNFVNWGWALTPQPNRIPFDGSTLNIIVDGVNIGHPNYNVYRSDIAGLFPGYANSSGAVGYFYLDATAYENGIHTIQWTASDDAGNTDGIGSRYFTIQNTGSSSKRSPAQIARHSVPADCFSPVRVKKGGRPDREPANAYPDESGAILIETRELEALEIHFFDSETAATGQRIVNITPLPIGSTLDAGQGVFYWLPGLAYVGDYSLVFIDRENNRLKPIIIRILPKFFETE